MNSSPNSLPDDALGFIHRYIPPRPGAGRTSPTTLLLLHGTGGDENDLIPLGQALLPDAGILSPRGKVLEHGAPRFFRRLREGVFDQVDLAHRTDELATFIAAAATAYAFDSQRIIAVGFSNGANIAASLLLRRPGLVRNAVLLSPMVPFEPASPPNLAGTAVFIGAGQTDTMVPGAQTERLAELLRQSGAKVALHWTAGGHGITTDELQAAHQWIQMRAWPPADAPPAATP